MGLFKKTKKRDTWLAMVPLREGIAATSVVRGAGRPAVECALFFPGAASVELLDKAGKEVRAADYRCTTLLAGGEYQLLSVDAPNVPDDELKTAVRWRLKDMLDFPVNDASIDVLRMPVDSNAPVRPQPMLLVAAARNTVVAARQKLFAGARVGLSVIDIPELAQRNIAAMLEPEGRGLAMLTFDDVGGLLTVTYSGELYLARRIDIPATQLSDPDPDRRHQGFDRITLELQRSLDNFERQFSFINVSGLVLGPGTVVGLDEYLSSNLYVPVSSLDLASVFDLQRVPELADKSMQQRFFSALGAALRTDAEAA